MCDAAAATATAERLITTDGIAAIVGGDCSGVTGATLQNGTSKWYCDGFTISNITSSSTAEDDGLFFRTAPSDARQGQIVADILKEKGVSSIALTYTNNDYGKGLADAIQLNFEAAGGDVTISAVLLEDGKGDYSAEVGALAQAGGEVLVVAGYLDQGGKGIIQGALIQVRLALIFQMAWLVIHYQQQSAQRLTAHMVQTQAQTAQALAKFAAMADGFDGTSAFAAESYDAAALIMPAAGRWFNRIISFESKSI